MCVSPSLTSDQNLEAYGSQALTSVVTSGMATLTRGRPLGHSMRKSLRYSGSRTPRNSRGEMIASASSTEDISVPLRARAGTYSPTPSTNRFSGTNFHELRGSRLSACSLDNYSEQSSPRSSVISVSSSSTLTSLSLGGDTSQPSPTLASPQATSKRQSKLTFEVRRAEGQGKGGDLALPAADVSILGSTSSSTTSSLENPEDANPEDTLTSAAVFDTPV